MNAGKNIWEAKGVFAKNTKNTKPENAEISRGSSPIGDKNLYAGVSGRGVGKVFGFSKANVYNWIKKRLRIWRIIPLFWSLMSFISLYERNLITERVKTHI